MEKGWSSFGGGLGFLKITIICFSSQFLFHVLFTGRWKEFFSFVIVRFCF